METQPQLYLITPTQFELAAFSKLLSQTLDEFQIACVRLNMPGAEEDTIRRAGDALRTICHDRDVPLLLADHFTLAHQLGLDGVHLGRTRDIRAARNVLGKDAIVGVHCGISRHDGMSAGEAGAEYISFGPLGASALGSGDIAPLSLFEWWSTMIEIPVVAEGSLHVDTLRAVAPFADFVALGPEFWPHEQPLARLNELIKAMSQ